MFQHFIDKGMALAKLHRYAEALKCFAKAISIEPSNEKI